MSLIIIPVPVGNLKDITLRAIDALNSVDFIVAEDTRYSLKLLNHLGIKKPLVSYYKPKEQEKSGQIVKRLRKGESAGLITDSGTPAISDPGFILVRRVIDEGIKLESLPGPTAFVPALVMSGIEPGRFLFLGFPPRKAGELKRFLAGVKELPYTLIFYESPRRVVEFLTIASKTLGNRRFVLVKELSKIHERVIRGRLPELDLLSGENLMGEMVIIIEGWSEDSGKPGTQPLQLNSMEDLFVYFKDTHNISKNQLKKVLMKKN